MVYKHVGRTGVRQRLSARPHAVKPLVSLTAWTGTRAGLPAGVRPRPSSLCASRRIAVPHRP